jgi:7-carboxy-7-deazaguanine synthase
MKIKLVKEGVFPITKDRDGNNVPHPPNTKYSFPGTLQGEGKEAGIPVLFVRTTGCNLRCTWETDNGEISICDTPYSSHNANEIEEWEIGAIVETLRQNCGTIRHLVISGGEPTIQPEPLVELARTVKQKLGLHITLETNGVYFIPELAKWIDLFSISPKLSSSEPTKAKNKQLEVPVDQSYIRDHQKFRRNITTIQKYINACMTPGSYYGDEPDKSRKKINNKDFQLKFVISRGSDIDEIENDFLAHLNFVENEDIVLMPAGGTKDFMHKTMEITAMYAVQKGWRFSPRLQIDLFDDTQNV